MSAWWWYYAVAILSLLVLRAEYHVRRLMHDRDRLWQRVFVLERAVASYDPKDGA